MKALLLRRPKLSRKLRASLRKLKRNWTQFYLTSRRKLSWISEGRELETPFS